MNTLHDISAQTARPVKPTGRSFDYPGQVVLVLQGGGALGAYQAGCTDTRRALEQACWRNAVDVLDGVIVHEIQGGA